MSRREPIETNNASAKSAIPQRQLQQQRQDSRNNGCEQNNTRLAVGSNISGDTENEAGDFTGVQRRRVHTKRFYMGGIAESTKKEKIVTSLNSRGVSPTLLHLFPSKRKGTLAAKINVHLKDCKQMMSHGFWPEHVNCRFWISNTKFESKKASSKDPKPDQQ